MTLESGSMADPEYSLGGYASMLDDSVRMAAYEAALRRACRPGSVALDLGTGTGVFALLACRLGARRVYAVDTSGMISVGREIARVNGVSDRIEFIQARSTDVSIAEPVDVVVADLRGALPPFGSSLATMMDARRFLGPNGVLIPAQDTIRCGVIEHPEAYAARLDPWRRHAFDFDVTYIERLVLNTWENEKVSPEALLSEPADIVRLDYARLTSAMAAGRCQVDILRGGIAHGLCLWFDTELMDGIGYSNAPGRLGSAYGRGFFPFVTPLAVEAGDVMSVNVRATPVFDDYVWNWDAWLTSSSGTPKGRSSQSTFFGSPLSMEHLRKSDVAATPSLGVKGSVTRFVLDRLDGQQTLTAIAEKLQNEFPDRFKTSASALAQVTAVVSRYGE